MKLVKKDLAHFFKEGLYYYSAIYKCQLHANISLEEVLRFIC